MSQAHDSFGNGRVEALEQRIHRLENAVAAFQDTRQLEERLTERVADRVRGALPLLGRNAGTMTVDVRTPLLPSARSVVKPHDLPSSPAPSWLLVDIYQDGRAILRMFFDHRYRTSPWVGLITVAILAAIAFSWFFRLPILLVGDLIAIVFQIGLMFVLFKVLTREARRYRSMIPQ